MVVFMIFATGEGYLALMLQTQACCENMDWALGDWTGVLGWLPGLASLFVFVVDSINLLTIQNPSSSLSSLAPRTLWKVLAGTKLLAHSHSLGGYAMTSQCHMTSPDRKPIYNGV